MLMRADGPGGCLFTGRCGLGSVREVHDRSNLGVGPIMLILRSMKYWSERYPLVRNFFHGKD